MKIKKEKKARSEHGVHAHAAKRLHDRITRTVIKHIKEVVKMEIELNIEFKPYPPYYKFSKRTSPF